MRFAVLCTILLCTIYTPVRALTGMYSMTYYADTFVWKRTALWDVFRHDGFSSALCSVPLWSLVHVQLGATGMVLKVNDRPNCQQWNDLIDVPKNVFTQFAPLSRGRITGATVTPWEISPVWYEKRFLSSDTFASSNILLSPNIPNTYCTNESMRITGSTLSDAPSVTAVMIGDDGSEWVSSVEVEKNTGFTLFFPWHTAPGKYTLSLANSTTVRTDTSATVWIMDCDELDTLELPRLTLPNVFPRFLPSLMTWYSHIRLGHDMYRIRLTQWDTDIDVQGKGEVLLPNVWLTTGTAAVSIAATTLSTPFSHDQNGAYTPVFERNVLLVPEYPRLLPVGGRVFSLGKNGNVRFRSPAVPLLQGEFFVTLPDGSVRSYSIPRVFLDAAGNVLSWNIITLRFPLEMEGVYLVEIPDTSGRAWINAPLIYGKDIWPILPSPLTSAPKRILTSRDTVRENQYRRLTAFREEQKLSQLAVDPILEQIAQEKAEDMLLHGYVGHRDFQGRTVSDVASAYAETIGSDLIGENVAGGNQSDSVLFEWLKLSGGHRYNMLFPEWKKIGIGYAARDGQVYLVQVFGN